MGKVCGAICEVYSRVCGYFRPVADWNKGKKEEFKDRQVFALDDKGKVKNEKQDNSHSVSGQV